MKKLTKTEILVIRSVAKNMVSANNFVYPKKGIVVAPDWKDNNSCGHGLHGLPWGVGGNYCAGSTDNNCLWLAIRVDTSKGNYQHGTGDMTDKCKFKTGFVEFCGSNVDVVAFVAKYAPANVAGNWSMQKAGDESTQTAGNWSTQTAGDESTQTAGNWSMQKAGDESTQTAGDESTQTAGNWSMQKAGNWSTQKAGDKSTQTAGNWSTQTAGYKSTQTAGNWSMQKAGNWSTQTAGDKSTQTAGDESTQTAGNWSMQKAGNWSTQKADLNTVQIIHQYKNGGIKVYTRTITKETANKWYKFENDNWRLCIEKEIKIAEEKCQPS